MLYSPWMWEVRFLEQPTETAFPTDLPKHVALAQMALTKQWGNSQAISGTGQAMESVSLYHLPLLTA